MSGEQVIERIMLGAHLAGICAVLYRDGHGAVPTMLSELDAFLEDNGHESPEAFRGVALGSIEHSRILAVNRRRRTVNS